MKRFYKKVSTVGDGDAYAVALDGKTMRTRAKAAFLLPNELLAREIAVEWEEQGDTIEPQSMPLTRLAGTAIDRIAPARARVIDELMAYAETDLLCHRADRPAELVARQEAAWQPLLDWAGVRFSANLSVTIGVLPQPQPEPALAALRQSVTAYDDMMLAGLHSATTAAGSLVVGLALTEERIDSEEAFDVSQIDETYQIERWGMDDELAARRSAIREDLEAIEKFMRLLADKPSVGD